MNVAVLLSVLTSARSRGSHADVAERKSHSATMHTNTMMSAFVVRMFYCFTVASTFVGAHDCWRLESAHQRARRVGPTVTSSCGTVCYATCHTRRDKIRGCRRLGRSVWPIFPTLCDCRPAAAPGWTSRTLPTSGDRTPPAVTVSARWTQPRAGGVRSNSGGRGGGLQ